MGLSLTYTALFMLSVKFIVQLRLCIKLNDHYNETDSRSITHSSPLLQIPNLLESKGSITEGYATPVKNY